MSRGFQRGGQSFRAREGSATTGTPEWQNRPANSAAEVASWMREKGRRDADTLADLESIMEGKDVLNPDGQFRMKGSEIEAGVKEKIVAQLKKEGVDDKLINGLLLRIENAANLRNENGDTSNWKTGRWESPLGKGAKASEDKPKHGDYSWAGIKDITEHSALNVIADWYGVPGMGDNDNLATFEDHLRGNQVGPLRGLLDDEGKLKPGKTGDLSVKTSSILYDYITTTANMDVDKAEKFIENISRTVKVRSDKVKAANEERSQAEKEKAERIKRDEADRDAGKPVRGDSPIFDRPLTRHQQRILDQDRMWERGGPGN